MTADILDFNHIKDIIQLHAAMTIQDVASEIADLFPGARRSLTQGEQVRALVLGSTGLVQ